MANTSAYVHSNADNADLLVNVNMIDNIAGVGLNEMSHIESTIIKLNAIKDQLHKEAQAFLDGYSIEGAQTVADRAPEVLQQLANEVLYGPDAYSMASSLTRNQKLNNEQLLNALDSDKIGKSVLTRTMQAYLNDGGDNISGLTNAIISALHGDSTEIIVSEGGADIVRLGSIFDVSTIQTKLRKTLVAEVSDNIFKAAQTLKTNGVYKGMITDLIRSSSYTKTQTKKEAIANFCKKLGNRMKKLGKEKVHFMWSSNPNELDRLIDEFIQRLKPQLLNSLNENKMLDRSNVTGSIGEEVRESISKSLDTVFISLQIGNLSEESNIEQINQSLKKMGATETISPMNSYHTKGKMSQSDLVLLNTNSKRIARAQSKNHFVAHFINNKKDDVIDNFRWKVEDSVNLLGFIDKLSNSSLGMSLNGIDLSNISGAIANNLWFQHHDSAWRPKGEGAGELAFAPANAPDIKKELEGSLEKLLAGQVTNLLGVTLSSIGDQVSVVSGASNIFYILNGRLKETADLVQQAIDQIQSNVVKGLSIDKGRLVNVTISGGNAGGDTADFLIQKLRQYPSAEGIGEAKGQEILDSLNISVSLGTSISSLKTTSFLI